MKAPGFSQHPGHLVETERMHETVEIFLDDDCILETQGAIKVRESDNEERIYVPINDLTHIDLVKIGDFHSEFMGDGEIYNVKHGDKIFENAAWSFVNPYDEVLELMGRVAFFKDKVQEIRVN